MKVASWRGNVTGRNSVDEKVNVPIHCKYLFQLTVLEIFFCIAILQYVERGCVGIGIRHLAHRAQLAPLHRLLLQGIPGEGVAV